jgi:iron complex transport system substrate-binding protein
MKFSRIAIFCLLSPALLNLLSCQPSKRADGNDRGGISVMDFRGKELHFNSPPKKIVCLIESALSGLYMLGAESRVIGVSSNVYQEPLYHWYADMDARIRTKQLPVPGNWDFVSIESIVALQPDLVILWSQQTESISALEERGIAVFGVFINGREDVYREMLLLGQLTGRESRAAELVDDTRRELAAFERRLAPLPAKSRPGVYFMWAQGNLETSGRNSTVNELIQLAGGRNVCAEIPNEHLIVNLERVISWNPAVILMWYNERKEPEDILAEPAWQGIEAVKQKRVHEFPEIFLCDLWTLKFQYAAKMVAKWTQPDLFPDLDLNTEGDRMLGVLYAGKLKGKSGHAFPAER